MPGTKATHPNHRKLDASESKYVMMVLVASTAPA
jgi:hypothetical protein